METIPQFTESPKTTTVPLILKLGVIVVALSLPFTFSFLLKEFRHTPSHVGRYQLIQLGNGNGPAFILDTTTGTVIETHQFADYNKEQERPKKQSTALTTAQ